MPLHPRAIVQCSLEGEDIRVFDSANDVCDALGIVSKDKIYKAIKHGFVAYHYRWRYLDSPIQEYQGYHMRNKPVVVSLQEQEIRYPSIDIASKAIGVSISHIQQAILTGGTAKGYSFYLEGEQRKPKANRVIKPNAVVALGPNGEILREWSSVKECALDLGVHVSAVYQAVNSKRGTARCKGYRLRYK